MRRDDCAYQLTERLVIEPKRFTIDAFAPVAYPRSLTLPRGAQLTLLGGTVAG